jgi:hypothetical protein
MTSQWLRVVMAFMLCADSTTGEIYSYLERQGCRTRNITGRMSDVRQHGVIFSERKDGKYHRYSVTHLPEAVAGMVNFTFKQPESNSVLNLNID